MTEPTQQQRDRARAKLLRRRALDLTALAASRFADMSTASEPVREDLTQRRETYLMGTDPGDVDNRYIEEIASFGRQEGFDIIVADFNNEYTDASARAIGSNVSQQDYASVPGGTWTEDVGQSGMDGQLSLPPRLDWRMLTARLQQARQERSRAAAAAGTPIVDNYMSQGRVAQSGEGEGRLSFGLATGRQMRLDLGYLERGNVLVGTRRGGTPYALVGADSVALSRASLEVGFDALGLNRSLLSGEKVLVAIAKDIGVARNDLVPVEQPGVFHLDMAMTPWTAGIVLLNDMMAVQRVVQQVHGNGVQVQHASRFDNAERMVERSIRAAGLRVVRVPGRFPPVPTRDQIANFFNGEGGVAGRGATASQYWITQGGPRSYTDAFVSAIRAAGVTVPRIHQISSSVSQASLESAGGTNCRVVPIPSTP